MTAHPTFTPSAMTPQDLDAITVGREALFGTLVHRIGSAASEGARPHTLLIAPRGAGKTHTLHIVINRVMCDSEVSKHVLPVMIPEDSLAITSYIDLLVEIARAIDDELGDEARTLRRTRHAIDIEQAIISAAAGRMILLAIENLDRVFAALGQSGQGGLRAWVETSSAIMVFATAPALFTGVSSRSYPWYGSFMVETIPDLSLDEGATMLRRAAHARSDDELATFIDSPTGRERLQAIRRLAGGSPRLWHILSECIDVHSLDALLPAVEGLLDRLTPYYQQQLWQLSLGEQRLVVELARTWAPRTVGDLAEAVGVSNQNAATALGRLAKSRWVVAAKMPHTDQRSSWYDLSEPLLRYHLQYREDRGKPLRLIVEFLRTFYSRERLLDELTRARPESVVERYLQKALTYGPEDWWFRPAAPGDLPPLDYLATVFRLWLANEQPEIVDVARALDALLSQARGDDDPEARFLAGLTALRETAWSDEQQDTLLLVELIVADSADYPTLQRISTSSAVVDRRTSKLALWLRWVLASMLADSDPDAALATANAVLDDIAGDRHVDLISALAWQKWAEFALQVDNIPPRPVGSHEAAGVGIYLTARRHDITWEDLRTALSALPETAHAEVAFHILFNSLAGRERLPYADALTELMDDTGRSLIDFAKRLTEPPAR